MTKRKHLSTLAGEDFSPFRHFIPASACMVHNTNYCQHLSALQRFYAILGNLFRAGITKQSVLLKSYPICEIEYQAG